MPAGTARNNIPEHACRDRKKQYPGTCLQGLQETISRNMPAGTAGSNEKPEPGQQLYGPRFDPRTYRKRRRSVSNSDVTFAFIKLLE
jgi:hypothetical protein